MDFIEGRTVNDLRLYPLFGKHLSLLGDSISSYVGTIPSGNDVYYNGSNSGVSDSTQMWWNILCRKTGMIPLVINGWSGSAITTLTDSNHASKVPMSDSSRTQALHNGEMYGFWRSPQAAADDVYTHATGCSNWDLHDCQIDNAPVDLTEWEKI